ncbi:MAG TPA: sulfotransferase [Bacteroidia bacterium]|nr:sulfotransferase [Bacteroidia bacterium]
MDFYSAPRGWFPWKPAADGNFHWIYLGNKKFDEPFFEETIHRRLSLEENSSFRENRSSAASLVSASQNVNAAEPAAFIFHVSRCGSTLLSQLLSEDPANIVLPEVPLFDDLLLRMHEKKNFGDISAEQLLTASIKLMCAKKNPEENSAFIKLDSWHIFHYAVLRKLYPRTPFVFLYRHPAEVIRSHARQAGMQMIPGLLPSSLTGIELTEEMLTNHRFYAGKMLERFFECFLRAKETDGNFFSADYADGIENAAFHLLRQCGAEPAAGLKERFTSRLLFHSKRPGEKFAAESSETGIDGFSERAAGLYEKVRATRDIYQRPLFS